MTDKKPQDIFDVLRLLYYDFLCVNIFILQIFIMQSKKYQTKYVLNSIKTCPKILLFYAANLIFN